MSLSSHVLEASDGFINITNYSKDDLAKLSIGDFVKFSGTFYFNTVTNIDISCDNKNFDIKISYTPIIDKNFNFDADTKYSTIFKGIWGSFVVDLFDIESSFEIASPLKDFSSDDTKASENQINMDNIEQSSADTSNVNEESKSILDKLLEQQYWNTELAKENEDLSKKLTHAQCTNRDLREQVETLSKQVETLTTDRDNLSSRLRDLSNKLNIAKNAEDTIMTKYNNLVKTYNQIRNDCMRLRDRELKVSIKNIILRIVEIILLSPLVMFKFLLIYSFLFALFGLYR